jgi:hypothetical protein
MEAIVAKSKKVTVELDCDDAAATLKGSAEALLEKLARIEERLATVAKTIGGYSQDGCVDESKASLEDLLANCMETADSIDGTLAFIEKKIG